MEKENLPETARGIPLPAEAFNRPRSFFQMDPADQIVHATKIAGVLHDVIQKQNLFTNIQGRKYVRLEGWLTLGTFLGITARERNVFRHDDGSYEAFVDLIKFADGTVVGGASALCSIAEKRWATADEYARRSMAITRATGKAYRSNFAWIVALAGYEPTPEEEMPREEMPVRDLKSEIRREAAAAEVYTGTKEQQEKILAHCKKEKIGEEYYEAIDAELLNKPFTKISVGAAIHKAMEGVQNG